MTMEPWKTSITTSDEKSIFIRGYDVTSLMTHATFTDVIYLLHQSRLPTRDERRLLDAILIGVSDHGPSAPSAAAARIVVSGNRQSLEASIAAGILAMGDAHGRAKRRQGAPCGRQPGAGCAGHGPSHPSAQ